MLETISLLTIVGFLKTQFGLEGRKVVIAAFLVGLVLFLQSDIIALTGPASVVVGHVFDYLRYVLMAAGSYDLVTDAGPKVFATLAKSK